jgi:hypothetical protein
MKNEIKQHHAYTAEVLWGELLRVYHVKCYLKRKKQKLFELYVSTLFK